MQSAVVQAKFFMRFWTHAQIMRRQMAITAAAPAADRYLINRFSGIKESKYLKIRKEHETQNLNMQLNEMKNEKIQHIVNCNAKQHMPLLAADVLHRQPHWLIILFFSLFFLFFFEFLNNFKCTQKMHR